MERKESGFWTPRTDQAQWSGRAKVAVTLLYYNIIIGRRRTESIFTVKRDFSKILFINKYS